MTTAARCFPVRTRAERERAASLLEVLAASVRDGRTEGVELSYDFGGSAERWCVALVTERSPNG